MSEWLFGDGVEVGSGIAGMMSILSLACREGHFAAWDGHVFFDVRTARAGFFFDELEAFRARYPARPAVTVALTDEDVPASLASECEPAVRSNVLFGRPVATPSSRPPGPVLG